MRLLFVNTLAEKGADRDFSFIIKQNGMFSFSGLTKEQVLRLREEVGGYTCNVHAARGNGIHAKLFTQAQHLLFGQAAEGEHAVLLDDEAEVTVSAVCCL